MIPSSTAARHDGLAGGRIERDPDPLDEHDQAEEAEDDRGNARKEIDRRLDRGSHPVRGELGQVDRRGERERYGDDHRADRDEQGADDQREDAERR
jgi:hypothetical protein